MPLLNFLFERRRPDDDRTTLAALIAPLLAMYVYVLLMMMSPWSNPGNMPLTPLDELYIFLLSPIAFSLFAYAGMVVIGIPTIIVLRRLRAERGIIYLVVGGISIPLLVLLIGAISGPEYAQPSPGSDGFDRNLFAVIALCVLPGLLTAGVYWLIASHRAERLTKPPR